MAPYRADLRAGDGQLVLRIADGKFVFRAGDGKFVLRTAEGKLLLRAADGKFVLRAADGKLVPRASEGKPLPPENAESITHIFDTYGKEILDGSGNRDITIMDELGFFESGALAFQQAVMRRISGGIPTLGVIKPRHTEFLDAVRAHEGVEIWEVDESNRAAVLTRLLEREWR